MESPLLQIDSVCIHIREKEILRNISMEIMPGDQWIIFGEAGSGKTILAQTLAGHHAFKGRIDLQGFEERTRGTGVVVVEQQHRFLDLQNQSNFYYQQRYNAIDAEATITVLQALDVFDEEYDTFFKKSELIAIFHLDQVLNEPLIQLSNGENKRALNF